MTFDSECLSSIKAGSVPFARLVAYDIYDGPVSGLIECQSTKEWFLFRLLAWDEQQHHRVFSLAPISSEVATKTVSAFAQLESPRWPEWWLNAAGNESAGDVISQSFERAGRDAGLVCCVIVAPALLGALHASACILSEQDRTHFEKLNVLNAVEPMLTTTSYMDWMRFIEAAGEIRSVSSGQGQR